MLGCEPDMQVVATAGEGEEAVRLFRQHCPDVTIMDLQLRGTSGVEAIRLIRNTNPEARIIVLTIHHGEEDIYRAMAAGATTYVLKDALFEELVDLVRGVDAGEAPIPANIARLLSHRAAKEALTLREVEILEHVAQGFRNKEIGAALGITEQTVKVHVRNVFAKLGVADRTAALTVALQKGIIHLS